MRVLEDVALRERLLARTQSSSSLREGSAWEPTRLRQHRHSLRSRRTTKRHITASLSYNNAADAAVRPSEKEPRTSLRLAIPSKGRMAEDTLALLGDCQLKVHKPNPRQYTASIPQMPGLEVWFQRATDVVRKLLYGDVDIGIVGYDMFSEIADKDPELLVVHDALGFGNCHLGLGVPTTEKFASVNTLDDLRRMPEWTETKPLRVVTGYHNIARRFFEENNFEHVVLLSADGALEAAPLMGSADIILDLVSTGVTLRENNLKQIEGGKILESQGVLVANKRSLREDPRLLQLVRELIERFEAHLKADKYYSVIANMRGQSPSEVAERICTHPLLRGLQGPTIGEVYPPQSSNGSTPGRLFSATICIPKTKLYESINDLRKSDSQSEHIKSVLENMLRHLVSPRQDDWEDDLNALEFAHNIIGGSGVLVQPMTYIFDEEPTRWRQLLDTLDL